MSDFGHHKCCPILRI